MPPQTIWLDSPRKSRLRGDPPVSVGHICEICFLGAIEELVENEEKLTPNKCFRVHAKRSSPGGSMYSVSYIEMEVWSACDIFAQKW